MREKLREMDIRLTELADYLQVSRPTLYKFIDMYEEKKYKGIKKDVLEVFRYVDKTRNIGKKNVINYIIQNTSFHQDDDVLDSLQKSIVSYQNGNSCNKNKTEFIQIIAESEFLDELIPYLNTCYEVLKKTELNESDLAQISKFVLFKNDVITNKTLTTSNMKKIKEIIGE